MTLAHKLENSKFGELLVCDVKRLTRPRFGHEFIQFNDRIAFSAMSGEPVTGDLFDEPAQSSPPKSVQLVDVEEDYDPA